MRPDRLWHELQLLEVEIAATIASGTCVAKNVPVRWSLTVSRSPPRANPTTGRPAAIASTAVMQKSSSAGTMSARQRPSSSAISSSLTRPTNSAVPAA